MNTNQLIKYIYNMLIDKIKWENYFTKYGYYIYKYFYYILFIMTYYKNILLIKVIYQYQIN